MTKNHCIIFNEKRDILLIKKDNKYVLPSTYGNKSDLIAYLKKKFGLKVKDSYLIEKHKDVGNIYFYCEEPYLKNEFNASKQTDESMVWINEFDLKDILLQNNQSDLVSALTTILKSNFSFSSRERKDIEDQINGALESDNLLLAAYYNEIGMCLIMNKHERLKNIDENYKKMILSILRNDLSSILLKKEQEEIEVLKRTPLKNLTHEEAKKVGREPEWSKLYKKIFPCTLSMPVIEGRINYFQEELKFQDKDGFTPQMLVDMYKMYHGKTYEEVKEIVYKRRKEMKRKKK